MPPEAQAGIAKIAQVRRLLVAQATISRQGKSAARRCDRLCAASKAFIRLANAAERCSFNNACQILVLERIADRTALIIEPKRGIVAALACMPMCTLQQVLRTLDSAIVVRLRRFALGSAPALRRTHRRDESEQQKREAAERTAHRAPCSDEIPSNTVWGYIIQGVKTIVYE